MPPRYPEHPELERAPNQDAREGAMFALLCTVLVVACTLIGWEAHEHFGDRTHVAGIYRDGIPALEVTCPPKECLELFAQLCPRGYRISGYEPFPAQEMAPGSHTIRCEWP